MKVITPDELILNNEASVPDRAKVKLSPSASLAVTLPTLVWFSSTVKVEDEVITGLLSFKLVTLIVMSWVVELVPSLAVTVAV